MLPLAAAVIAALCVYRLTRRDERPSGEFAPMRRAPVLQETRDAAGGFATRLLDSRGRLFRFESWLGRHPIIVVFFDGESGAENDPALTRLRDVHERLVEEGIKVVAVSGALPQENWKRTPLSDATVDLDKSGGFPFPLVTDLPPEYRLHRLWGRYDPARARSLPGVFFIDRAGRVAWEGRFPRPVTDIDKLLSDLVEADVE